MLVNFIRTADLEFVWPDILGHRRGGQVDYADVIETAFKHVVNDFIQRGKKVRGMMVPVDLNRDAGSPMLQYLKSGVVTGSVDGYAWAGNGREGRLVVVVAGRTDDSAWAVKIQGSNESVRPADDSSYWADVCTVTIPADTDPGQFTETFVSKYVWYRRVVTLTGGTGTLTFTAAMYETTFDSIIVSKSLEMIAAANNTGLSPMWADRLSIARGDYESAIKTVSYVVDDDDDGYPDSTEVTTNTVQTWR